MFLKISDKECISTKDLRTISLTEKNDFIHFKFKDEEKSIELTQPRHTGVGSDYVEFANLVYAHCYMAIIMAELTAKCNINTSFDFILNDDDILLDKEDYEEKYDETKSEADTTDKKVIWNLMLADLIDDVLEDLDEYMEEF